jgi:hypothetical protein
MEKHTIEATNLTCIDIKACLRDQLPRLTFLFISLSMSSRPALWAPRVSSCLCINEYKFEYEHKLEYEPLKDNLQTL